MNRARAYLPARIVAVAVLALPRLAGAHEDRSAWFSFAPALAGTTWSASDVTGTVIYRFQPGGSLEYEYGGHTYRNASWKQEGPRVLIEINDGFSERSGKVLGGRIVGEGWNRHGQRWLWDAHQVRWSD